MGLMFALGAGGCCLLLGLAAATGLAKRRASLTGWAQALERMACALQERRPLPQVLAAGAEADRRLGAACALMAAQPLCTPQEAWQAACRQYPCLGEQAAEAGTLARLFDQMSHGSLESRAQALAQAEEQMRLIAAQAEEREKKNRSLYRSLGGLGGLALALLLL